MLLVPLRWERIKVKTGDDITITLNPVERALLFGLLANAMAEHEQGTFKGSQDDADNFDAIVSGLTEKVGSQE
jgi:hypothetical protein